MEIATWLYPLALALLAWGVAQNVKLGGGKAAKALTDYYAERTEKKTRQEEIGEIVAGKKPGRSSDAERIIDFNYGLAIEDILIANEIYARAISRGIGSRLTLLESDFD